MSDVVFITPNLGGTMVDECVGTLQLASILKAKGISCDVLPYFRIGNVDDFEPFVASAVEMVLARKCRIVSFYTRCDTYHICLRLAQRLKASCPELYIVCGGPQSDITAEETIRQLPYVDFVCCGEGETTVYPFFSSLLAGSPDLTVDGLVYRQDGQVKKNPRPALLENLDELPMIDYTGLFAQGEDIVKGRPVTIDVGRGCPFGCSFCSTKTFWGRKYRLKSPQRICAEIQAAHDAFGDVRVEFAHDMFTMNRGKVMETCRLIKQLDFPVKWYCSARLDCVDRELIDVMADAGLSGIYFGVETGSPRMQKLVHKNLKLDHVEELIDYIVSKDIGVTASFIFGFPEETEEDLSQTMALIGKLIVKKKTVVQTHLCAFMAGTELSQTYRAELTPADYYSDQTGDHAVEECKDLILGHPELFQHMLEYKTELRTKLKHFELFFRVWKRMPGVYRYLAEKYPENRLVDMYYDFVRANREVLDTVYELDTDWSFEIVKHDRFPELFAGDENYDIIADLYRYARTEISDAVMSGGSASGIFCINPLEAWHKPLQECTRCIAVLKWADHKRSVNCFPK